MGHSLVIVESPAKAKTINKYLGKDYTVLASYGHVRDLPPKDGSVLPDEDFAMSWAVDAKSKTRLSDISKAIKNADKLILATDPDREGEAISWHVLQVLNDKKLLKDKTSSGLFSTRSRKNPFSRPWNIRARSMMIWLMPIWPAGHWTILSAFRFRRSCGANCPVHALPAGCNR